MSVVQHEKQLSRVIMSAMYGEVNVKQIKRLKIKFPSSSVQPVADWTYISEVVYPINGITNSKQRNQVNFT